MEFDNHPDWDETDYRLAEASNLMRRSPGESLAMVLRFIDDLDDDKLCSLGVAFVEPLLDLHWGEIGREFEVALGEHVALRKALSCAWLRDDDLQRELDPLIGPGEDIGRHGMPTEPKPTWEQVDRPLIRDVRISDLVKMSNNATNAGIPSRVEVAVVERVADPGASHMLWPRFKCTPVDDSARPFYRCAVHLHLAHQRVSDAVFEADFLVADVETMPETQQWRVAAHFRRYAERLPGVTEL